MKEAMWRVDPGGGFTFSDATNFDQMVLFQPEVDRRLLRTLIGDRFGGRRVTVRDLERFVIEDTPFLAGHYKRVLAEMEGAGKFTPVNPPRKRRKGTYPDPALMLDFAQ